MNPAFLEDVNVAATALADLPVEWDGKQSILELQEADYNWRQMEWAGFYFEYLCRRHLQELFEVPGESFGSTTFDAKRSVNWDFKWHAIKTHSHKAILNDKQAMEDTIAKYGAYGVIVCLCDVDYNDINRTFQKWHSEIKGGLSKYEMERRQRTAASRYRKTRAILYEILFLHIGLEDLPNLGTMRQGRNSNGAPRPEKYMVNLEDIDDLFVRSIVFTER